MSKTDIDSAKNRQRDIEVRQVEDTFDVLQNGKIICTRVSERTLNDILCAKWGYCGPEFDQILEEVRSVGHKAFLL